MYHTCIFCHASLGANEALEAFPVARRVAFDPAKGRLWAVCGACGRWNLSPLETRWEAIDEAERLYRDTHTRVATPQIGLARVADGTALVRIGQPLRPEFAAWRYGDQFGHRARRAWLRGGLLGGLGLAAGSVALANAPVLVLAFPVGIQLAGLFSSTSPRLSTRAVRRAERSVTDREGQRVLGERDAIVRARLCPGEADWALELGIAQIDAMENQPFRIDRKVVLRERAAVRALGVLLPTANGSGGSRSEVRSAVRRIESAGDPERYFRQAELDARKMGWGYCELWHMPSEIRLALEMAAHEEAERRALEGELAGLERQWRDAEAIAAVADRLALPGAVERRLERLRAKRG